MLKFLNYFLPSGLGAAGVLSLAYVAADQFVVDIPSAPRMWVAPVTAQDSTPAPQAETVVPTAAGQPVPMRAGYGLGRDALPEEIAAWDIDVRPDGQGLPPGSGDVLTGEDLFVDNCAMCHGDFGEAVGRWPVLAGGKGTLTRMDPVKTIGSYWPYLSTVWDYVHRAMPFGNAQSLQPDEVYAITAYLLYVNDLVDEDFVLSNENLAGFEMPNVANFYPDDRPETELVAFSAEACMEGCKDSVEITMRALVLDVTPDTGETEAAAEPAAEPVAEPVTQTAAAEATPETAPEAAVVVATVDPEMAAAGERNWKKCQACHQIGEGATNRTGPALTGIVGRTMGAVEGFRYSAPIAAAGTEGRVWDAEALTAFLRKPRDYMPGTKMSFAGLRSDQEAAEMIAYLLSQSP